MEKTKILFLNFRRISKKLQNLLSLFFPHLSGEYSHCTTRLFLILCGDGKAGCHTRQSNFFPFMLFSGWRKYWVETTPPLKLRLDDCPGWSVSQDSRGTGCPEERHEATCLRGSPSTRMTGSREVMGMTGREKEMIWDSDSWHKGHSLIFQAHFVSLLLFVC